MKTSKYLTSMLPSFERSRIKEDLGLLREELKDIILPVYENAAKVMRRRTFLSKDIQEFDKVFTSNMSTRTRGNFIVVIHEILDNTFKNLDNIETMVDRYYSEDIYRDAMTYLKINLIQYVESISFACRYSRALLLYVYAAEINMIEGEDIGKELTPGEREWLRDNKRIFIQVMNILALEKKDIESHFETIPEVLATPENDSYLPRTVGANKLDPFQFGLIPVALNPIYHARMCFTEWQVNRLRAAQEEKRMLEFRLIQLKMSEDGKEDPRLVKNIAYTDGRLKKLNAKVRRMEEEYA